LFCNGSARAIVAMLLAECAQGGVDVRVGHTVTDIFRADRFRPRGLHRRGLLAPLFVSCDIFSGQLIGRGNLSRRPYMQAE
jgi:hypothetical protein